MTEAALQQNQKAAEEHAHIAETIIGPPDPIVASEILLLGFTWAEVIKRQGGEGGEAGNRDAGGSGGARKKGSWRQHPLKILKLGDWEVRN